MLDHPNDFGWVPNINIMEVQFVLFGSKSFWTGPIMKISPEKSSLNLTKMIWTQPKQSGWSKIILDLWKDKAQKDISKFTDFQPR